MAVWKRTGVRNMPEYRRNEDMENMFVFGYQCKLFRDDTKARFLDQGRHLIPWMGDPSLMIDRYDGRGHLHDLNSFVCENPSSPLVMSEEEMRMEELCNEERYMELTCDLREKEMYEEEELKRLNEAISYGYSAVAFNYDQGQGPQSSQDQEEVPVDEEDEPYYAPPELQMPANVLPPETLKQNAIIEKTALFISKHSAQMEIMIKTKQKDNAQFDFLNYHSDLNPYYKHVVKMIKSGKFMPHSQRKKENSHSENKDGYLHPSLSKAADQPPVIKEQTREEFMLSVSSKLPSGQIANTPYAKLLSNLSKHTGRNSPQPPPPQASTVPAVVLPPVVGVQLKPVTDALATNGQQHPIPGMMAPGIVPVGMMPPGHVPTNMEHESDGVCYEEEPGPVHGPQGVPPPPDIQPVIDKMATYVAKNGPEFEVIVRRKNDVRFQFLNEGHVHNAYYEHKKKLHQKEIAEAKAKEIEEEESEESEEEPTVDEDTISHQNKSISFSVRSKENADNLSVGLRTTALPYESSDEEDGNVHKMNGKERGEKAAVASEMMQPATEVKPTGVTERKQAENRVKDKLAHAARDKLAQAKRENQLKAERKRKAAMFINMLKTSQPTSATAKQEETTADSATISPASAEASPAPLSTHSSRHQSPMLDISPELIDSGTSTPVRIIQASGSPNLPRSFKSRSRSPRRRSRSPRQRSPSLRHRSRSPRRRRKRSKTPPSSYDYRVSPVKKCRSRSKSPVKYKRSRRHSRSRSKDRDIVVKSTKVIPRSRSRSKTRHKSPSVRPSKRSRSPDKSRSKRKSRSRSRTRKRSRSRNRKRSRSRTRKNKAKKKKSSRSPKKKKSDDKKNHSKHKSSTRSKDKGSSHAIIINSENCEVTVIDDDNPDGIEDMVHLIDSDTTESSRSSSASSSPERPSHLHQEEIRVSCPPSPKNHIVIDANPRSSPQYVASSYLEMEAERSRVYSLSPNTDSTTMQHVASKSPMREAKRLPPVEPPSPPRDTAKRKSVEPPSHRIDSTLRTASSPKAQVANILTSSSATSRQKSTKRNTSVVKTVEPVTPVIDMFAD